MVLNKSIINIFTIFSLCVILISSTGCQQSGCNSDSDCNECEQCINNNCTYIQDCCMDTDEYYDYYNKGISRINENIKEDTCYKREKYNAGYDSTDECSGFGCGITEYGCHDNKIVSSIYDCPYGCKDGACINAKSEDISGNCFDTDGNNTFVQGQVIHRRSNNYNPELNYQLVSHSDVCLSNGYALSKSGDSLNEQICENDKWVSQKINCTCQDGVCINETTQSNIVPDEPSDTVNSDADISYEESSIEQFEKIQVSDEDLKKISVALTSEDIDYCDSLTESKDLCLAYFGIKNDNYSSCEELDGKSKYLCYMGIITNRVDFKKCYDTFTEVNPGTFQKEDLGEDGAIFYCNYYIFILNEINSCENKPEDILVANKALAWERACEIYNDISGQNDLDSADVEKCINSSDERCLLDLYYSTHDESICDMITSSDNRYLCFNSVAVLNKDISLCPNSDPFCVSRILGLEKMNI